MARASNLFAGEIVEASAPNGMTAGVHYTLEYDPDTSGLVFDGLEEPTAQNGVGTYVVRPHPSDPDILIPAEGPFPWVALFDPLTHPRAWRDKEGLVEWEAPIEVGAKDTAGTLGLLNSTSITINTEGFFTIPSGSWSLQEIVDSEEAEGVVGKVIITVSESVSIPPGFELRAAAVPASYNSTNRDLFHNVDTALVVEPGASVTITTGGAAGDIVSALLFFYDSDQGRWLKATQNIIFHRIVGFEDLTLPSFSVLPVVTGTGKIGDPLTVDFSGNNYDTVTIEWLRGGEIIIIDTSITSFGAAGMPKAVGSGSSKRALPASGTTTTPKATGSGSASAGDALTASGTTTTPKAVGSGSSERALPASGTTTTPKATGSGSASAGDVPDANWYVATTGSDSNAGTSAAAPFATWQKAFDMVSAGETIAIRGGTYALDAGHTFKRADYAMLATETAGSSGNPITVMGWDGRPVLDFSAVAGITYGWGLLADASWWDFIDLDFTGLQQGVGDFMLTVGCEDGTTTNQNWTRCRAYGNAGPGFTHYSCTNVVVTDCDAFENWDVQDGGNADGFAFAGAGTGNKWINCRSFDNSDDGFDCWNTNNRVEIEGCWAFRNGWEPGTSNTAGDGNGFKLGQNTAGTRHLVTRCLAFNNRQSGFDENGSAGVHTLYNNAAGGNGLFNYSFTASVAHVLTNNLSYDGENSIHATVVETTNSWQIGEPAPSIDFNSVSTAAADDARDSNGSLPSFDYLTHTDDSIFVDRGTDVGLAYQQAAPDIGWVESAFTQVPLPATWDYIGDGGQIADASGNFDLVEPAGTASGDLLVACIAYRSNAQITFPAGWTKIAATEQNSGNNSVDLSTNIASCVMGYIVRGGSAPSLTFTRTGGDIALGVIKAYRASAGTISVDDADSNTEASATTNPDCPSLTTTARGDLLVAMLAGADNFAVVPRYIAASLDAAESGSAEVANTTEPSASNWHLRESSNSTNGADVHLSVAETVVSAPASTGAISITSTSTIVNARHAMAAVAFKAT